MVHRRNTEGQRRTKRSIVVALATFVASSSCSLTAAESSSSTAPRLSLVPRGRPQKSKRKQQQRQEQSTISSVTTSSGGDEEPCDDRNDFYEGLLDSSSDDDFQPSLQACWDEQDDERLFYSEDEDEETDPYEAEDLLLEESMFSYDDEDDNDIPMEDEAKGYRPHLSARFFGGRRRPRRPSSNGQQLQQRYPQHRYKVRGMGFMTGPSPPRVATTSRLPTTAKNTKSRSFSSSTSHMHKSVARAKKKNAQSPTPTPMETTVTKSTPLSGMTPWVRRYLASRPGLLVIPRDFWLDNFNLVQLPPVLESWVKASLSSSLSSSSSSSSNSSGNKSILDFPTGWLYKQALACILAQGDDDDFDDPLQDKQNDAAIQEFANQHGHSVSAVEELIHLAADLLYQLLHQRYAVAPRGLEAIRRRFIIWQYQSVKKNPLQPPPYGRCPRTSCGGFELVPSGPDYPQVGQHKRHEQIVETDIRPWRYCACCQQTWRSMSTLPEASEGCAWGKSLGPLFHMTFPRFLHATQTSVPGTGSRSSVADEEPRIFGFRLHPSAIGRIRSKD